MTNDLLAEHPPAARSVTVRNVGLMVGAAVVGLLALLALGRLARSPSAVTHLGVTNDTPYELTITVSSRPGGAVTPLGIVPATSTLAFTDVIDAGTTWYFHISSQGVTVADLVVARTKLAADRWNVELGDSITAELRAAGRLPAVLPPTAPPAGATA